MYINKKLYYFILVILLIGCNCNEEDKLNFYLINNILLIESNEDNNITHICIDIDIDKRRRIKYDKINSNLLFLNIDSFDNKLLVFTKKHYQYELDKNDILSKKQIRCCFSMR